MSITKRKRLSKLRHQKQRRLRDLSQRNRLGMELLEDRLLLSVNVGLEAGQLVVTDQTNSNEALSDETLVPVLQQALLSWSGAGLAAGLSDRLGQIDVHIADLSSGILGETRGETVYLDINAAGYGWFVDPTPADDSEFGEQRSANLLAAGTNSPAHGHIDLLTVATHEFGHFLGFDHTDALASDGPDVMSDALGTGVRLLVSGTSDPLEASSALNGPAFMLADGATLNEVIDDLLTGFDTGSPPTGPGAEFTTGDGEIPNIINVGTTLGGGVDLEITDVTLQFDALAFDVTTERWTGQVGVMATNATLFKGLLDIVVTDDGNDTDDGDDVDLFAVAGVIDVAPGVPGTEDTLNLDDLDVEELGWPVFLDVAITDLALKFPNFRGNVEKNSMDLSVELRGFDTGNDTINKRLQADNPLYGFSLQGSASAELGITEIEAAVMAGGSGDLVAAMDAALAAALASELTGLSGSISGKLFGVGSLSAGFIYNTVTHDPDGPGPLPERSAVYLATEGSLSLGPAITGDDGDGGIASFQIAFAISELGPLQFFGSLDVPIMLEPVTGLAISSMRVGLRFNTTIEELQTETDFQTTGASVTADKSEFLVTLTIAGEHDLEGPTSDGTRPGDDFRISDADNTLYNGKFTVVSATESTVTYRVNHNPGVFVGSADITRLTIKDPLDLQDDGLNSGTAPPDNIFDWRDQLDNQVKNQIDAGGNIWDVLLDKAVFGGGASLSFDPRIPDSMLSLDVDFLLDTELRIMLVGQMSLLDGLVTFPTRMYADLSDLNQGSGRFLYLQTQPEVPVFEPLLVKRGAVAFEALTDGSGVTGFRTSLSGGVDLNVPGFDASFNPITVTTLTLEGEVTVEFRETSSDPGVKGGLELSLGFEATLSESNFVDGEIASAAGLFQLNVTVTEGATSASDDDVVDVVIVGAALLDTEFDFLEPVGLFVDASGFLRINSGDEDTSIELPDGATVNLPAESFALRLDGGVDFRIDFNGDDSFAESESVFQIGGIFVLEFSAEQGFNVAIFDEENNKVGPAGLTLGPKNSPLLEFGVLGFLAIRSDGIAADLVLTADAALPLGLASINAAAVFIVNTTGGEVVFDIPGGATDPNDPTGLSFTIPAAAPADPSSILGEPGSSSDPQFEALKTGSPTWDPQPNAGPYGVVFIKGELELLSVLKLDVSGYVLLSEDVVSLEANFSAAGNFLNLASASAHGTLFFSSQGEFVVDVGGSVQLGPNGFNIRGSADLEISHLDSDGKGSNGDGSFVLDIMGELNVSAEIFFIKIVDVNVDVAYNSSSGEITVGIGPVWVPVFKKACTRIPILGRICVYYPYLEERYFSFTVGTLKAVAVPPPPAVLGQVDGNGVLTLNVGPQAGARNLAVSEVNEGVFIDVPAGSPTGQVSITMFGVTQTFDDVTKILISDMGGGNDFVEISDGVATEVEVRFGDGQDWLKNRGSGVVIAYGDEGDDRLEGGSANDQLFGGLGVDQFVIQVSDLALSEEVDGGEDEDEIIIVGDASAQDLRVTMDNNNKVWISSYSDSTETGSVNLRDVEAISLLGGTGADSFSVSGELDLGGVTSGVVVDMGSVTSGSDQLPDGARDVVNLTLSDSSDQFQLAPTEMGAQGIWKNHFTLSVLSGHASDEDKVDVFAGGGNDSITVGGDDALNGVVGVNGLQSALSVNGQGGSDTLIVDDAADTGLGVLTGTLTPTQVTGLGMAQGITYGTLETLNIALGLGADMFTIASTHAGTTTVQVGGDNDTVDIETIAGLTNVRGQGGDDLIRVNDNNALDASETNGLAAILNLDGQDGNDDYIVNIFGNGDSLINVFDTGSSNSDTDELTINGTAARDDFLLRASEKSSAEGGVAFAAALHGSLVERTNYDENLENLVLQTDGGDDHVTLDDNWAQTVVRGGAGEDQFQVGQIFHTPRDAANANVADEDEFAVVSTPRGFLSNGVSAATVIEGGDDGDQFVVFRNKAALELKGDDGDDVFTIRSFAEEGSQESVLELGAGSDFVQYVANAAVNVKGGDGNDLLRVIGTEFSDRYLITATSIQGAGRSITYDGIEELEVDGAEGNDEFFVFSTFADVTTKLLGGLGSDHFHIGGDSKSVVAENNVVVDPQEGPHELTGIAGRLEIDGFSGLGSADGLGDPVMLPGETNEPTSVGIVLAYSGTGTGGSSDSMTVNTADLQAVVDVDAELSQLADLLGHTLVIAKGPGSSRFWQITGIVDGSVAGESILALKNPTLVPAEWISLDGTSEYGISNLSGNFFVDETQTIDIAMVFNDGSSSDDDGGLTSTDLTGLGMGAGGLAYGNLEILRVLLGTGDETFSVTGTADGMIAAVHGGGGDDQITVSGRGDSPLIVYGDTSEDRSQYASESGTVEPGFANDFDNDGGDTINAAGSLQSVVVYGGPGNDILTGSQADDHLAGGAGGDTVDGEAGADHIYGDSHFNVDLLLFAQDQITPFDPTDAADLAKINAMFTVPTTGTGGSDTINAGADNDIAFGDHGVIDQTEGTRRIETTGSLIQLQTTNLGNGGSDTIHGDDGNDFIFGGTANDTIYGDLGSDLALGDFGTVAVNTASGLNGDLIGTVDGAGVDNASAAFTYTSDTSAAADTSAGADTIHGGSLTDLDVDTGKNILLGQQAGDTVYGGGSDDDIYGGHNVARGSDAGDSIDGGAGNDVILADNGLIERTAAAEDPRFAVLQGTLIYDTDDTVQIDGNVPGTNPAAIEARRVELFDHDDSGNNAGAFGDDVVAGGADDDVIFGQLGNDGLHGDGKLALDGTTSALVLASLTATIASSDVGGDDYIEGNSGDDTIHGGLGQDDIVGGSSNLYSLDDASKRPDGADTIHGGNGDMVARNDFGAAIVDEAGNVITSDAARHARDADMVLGDNGNIFRLVGTNKSDSGGFLSFNYDNYGPTRTIVVRAAELLDYTAGGADFNEPDVGDPTRAAGDIGDADEIRGESGDDAIYGMVGNDILFGDAQDDDLIAGYGHDWASGGTGIDGVLGEDGRIYTSRNSNIDTEDEPLYGIGTVTQTDISTPGNVQQATINVTGELKKTVNLTPFNVDPNHDFQDPLYDAQYADDIIYGGLGDDFLHGGAGDDAMSGAEALPDVAAEVDGTFYVSGFDSPANLGNVLGFAADPARSEEFFLYDEFEPRAKILVDDGTHVRDFLLNFAASESDGRDRIFGDLGNDWAVGGTDQDHQFGGYGNDLLNADDDLDTSGGLNDAADGPDATRQDIVFGGAGRDVMIGNTGGDRLIDWKGEFNSYIVPFAPFGLGTVSRAPQPQLAEYLYDLSASDGADPTRAADTGNDSARNGEPDGELGLIRQQDDDWQAQSGAPDDPQPGNIPGGPRDVLRGADFNNGQPQGFFIDSGVWTVSDGRMEVAPGNLGEDAVSVYHIEDALPAYFEIEATINGGKPTGGLKSNASIVFDYQSPTDFKYAGVNISNDKMEIGYRDATGWHELSQANARLKPNQDYDVLLSLNGTVATLVVDNSELFTYVFDPRVDSSGSSYGLNAGMVGIGAANSKARIDNVKIQVLPPEITIEDVEDFSDGVGDLYTGESNGQWQITGNRFVGTSGTGKELAYQLTSLSIDSAYLTRVEATFQTDSMAGIVFDQIEPDHFKFVALDSDSGDALIGHYTAKKGYVIDASISGGIQAGADYTLAVTLKGTTVSVELDGQIVLGHAFNAVTVDGDFGLMSRDGTSYLLASATIASRPL